jgi:hypothetical protein
VFPRMHGVVDQLLPSGIVPPEPPEPVDPTDIPGLRLWLDASDTSKIAHSAGAVSAVTSKDENARVFNKGGTTLTTGADTLYGKNVLTSAAAYLTTADANSVWNFLHQAGTYHVFLLIRPGNAFAPGTFYGLFGTNGTTSAAHGTSLYYDDTGGINERLVHQVARNVSDSWVVLQNVPDNLTPAFAWSVLHLRVETNTATAADRSRIRVASRRVFNANAVTNPASATDATRALQIMAAGNNAGAMTGRFAEILAYEGDLTTQQVDDVLTHLWRWFPVRTTIERVLVAGDGVRNFGLPGFCVTGEGDYLAVYRDGPNHGPNTSATLANRGVLRQKKSTDGGTTWTGGDIIQDDGNNDSRDACLTRLANGDIMLSYMINFGSNVIRTYVRKSTDDGSTWGSQVEVTSDLTNPACSAPVVELANGDLLMPMYEAGSTVRVSRSTDGGSTWANLATIATSGGGVSYSEAYMQRLTNGDLLTLIRNDTARNTYAAVSDDDGATWSTPALVHNGWGRPAFTQLGNGTLVAVYRRGGANPRYQTMCRCSLDNGVTWGDEFALDSEYWSLYAQLEEVNASAIPVVYAVENPNEVIAHTYFTRLART